MMAFDYGDALPTCAFERKAFMIDRRRTMAAALGALSSVSLGIGAVHPAGARQAPADLPSATPLQALDGEKVRVNLLGDFVTIRLIGIDAPEPEVGENRTECGFVDSKQALQTAIEGRTLLLENDAEDKDDKGRLWRHVWIVNADGTDGGLLNELLLQNGWVTTREEEKNSKYSDRYQAAAQTGQANGVGLYATCTGFHQEVSRHGGREEPALAGEAVSVKGITASLDSYYYSYSDALGTAPDGGFMWLIISVTIVNNRESGKFNFSGSKFAAKNLDTDSDYDDAFAFLDAPLDSGELSTGEYVSGQVALEIQETATNVRLKFNIEGDYSLYWLVPPV
jgi:endonuclease YncB( thermonuclease family)